MLQSNSKRFAASADLDQRYKLAVDWFANKDYRRALDEAVALIDEGYGHAYTLAGAIYERGGNGVPQDYEKALFYYQRSIENVGAVEGYLALGRLFYFGKGVEQNYRKAYEYYSIVDADTENAVAYLMLGRLYHKGHGVKQNLDKAREYYEKAITKGYVFGLTYLGFLEQECGHYLKGWRLRLKAAYLFLRISARDPHDSRLRDC